MDDVVNQSQLEELWESRYHYGNVQKRIARQCKWDSYYSMIYAKEIGKPFHLAQNELVNYLTEQRIVDSNDTVLDIGCGTGTYGLPLAARCSHVTELDGNLTAIKVVEERAAQAGLTNIRMVCKLWEEFNEEKQYDVVLSAMCPAICNFEDLYRMESLAKRQCVIITVMEGSYDKHRSNIIRELGLKPEGMITESRIYLKALQFLSREVKLQTYSFKYEYRTSLQQMLDTYPTYLSIFGMSEKETVSFIKDYFMKNAVDGMIMDESQMNIAVISWNKEMK